MDSKIFSNKFDGELKKGDKKTLGFLVFNDVRNPKEFRNKIKQWVNNYDLSFENNMVIEEGKNEVSIEVIDPNERDILGGISSYKTEHNYNITLDGITMNENEKPRELILNLASNLTNNCGLIIVNRREPIMRLGI